MKKRVLSLFLVFVLCLTLLPTSVFAEGEDVSISGGVIGGGETGGEGGGIYVAPGSPTEGGGGTYIPGEDTQTEIWCVSKPDSIGRSYDGTTDGGTIPIDLTFTDGTNEIKLKEGTGFTAKKTFDSADAGWHTVTVEIELIGEAAVKYKLKAGEETFTIGGNINKAYPDLTVTLSKTVCTAGEKLLPLLSVEGAPKDAEVTYYYLASALKSWAGSSDVEGSDAMPKIDENTAISDPGTYYVYAKTGETKNYEEERSTTAELTVNEAVVEAASVTKADGTDGGTYDSLPAALNAAQDGDTVKLLADHVTDADALNALGENFTFAQYASIVPVVTKTLTLDLNHKTVDYLEVGFTETNEETQKKETLATGNLTVTGEAAYGRISNLMFMAGALDIRSGEIGGSGCAGLLCDANSGSVTVSNGTVYGLTVLEGASVTVNGGSKHAGEWVVASGATLNITDGTFGEVQFTRNGTIAISGGTFQSIKSYIAEELQPLMSLLDTQKVHAFYKGDDVQDGNATELADVTVKEHTHTMVNNKCACGFSCAHTNAEGASTIGADGKCTVCGTQFAAGIGETYYTDVKSALNAAADGQTVKLLANEMLPGGIYASKTLTLDLNGHSLDGYSLNVGGLTATSQVRTGKLTVIDGSGGNGAVGVTVRDGGTLVFNPENDHTTLLQLEVWGGTVELYGGKISRSGLRLNNNITLGNLLPRQAGLAYYRGDTQLTLEEAASQTCDLVVKLCSHGGKNGFDGTNCPYCNAPAVAETALNNGEGSRPWRRFANLQTAIDADRDGGSEFRLLTDVTGDYTIDGTQDTGLNLNGHSIKGTVTVKGIKGDFITTTLSNTENTTTASIDKVVAYKGAKLAGSGKPAVIGELTLAEGATWENILNLKTLGYKVLNADGTYKWYAPNNVKVSQLNNVIINSLPIPRKNLAFKVNGTNVKGNKVERGTTVQLCADCNTNGADVYIYTGEIVGNNVPTYSQQKATYQKIGTNWYYVVDLPCNTIGKYSVYFTATKDGYTVQSSEKTLTVTKAAIPASAITAPAANALTYNGSEQALATAGSVDAKYGEMQYRLGTSGSFSTAIPTATDAGTYTVYYKVAGSEGYEDSRVSGPITVTIAKKALTITDVTLHERTYDGEKWALAKGATFDDAVANEELKLGKDGDYTLSATFDSANAGTSVPFTATVMLNPSVKNYTLPNGEYRGTAEIKKAAAPTNIQSGSLNVINGTKLTYTYDAKQLLPNVPKGDYGQVSYHCASPFNLKNGYSVDDTNFTIKDGALTLTIDALNGEGTDKIGTISVYVTTDNYESFNLPLDLYAVNKITPVVDGDVTASEITYGDALSKSTISGKMKDPDTGQSVNGTFAWTDGTINPNAGGYEAEWTFTPAAGYEEYATATGTVTIKVNKATPTFTAPTAQENLTYTGWEQALITAGSVTSGGTMQYSLTENGTYSPDIPTGTDAGAYTVWYRVIGDANHKDTAPASVAVRIGQKPLTITGVTVASKLYDGTTNADITSVTFDNVTLKRDTDYNVTASFDYASVDSGKNVTATVTLMGQAAKNYALEQSSFPTTGSITKAAAPDFTKETALVIINGHEKTYTVTLPALPTLETPKAYGALTYEIGEIKLNDGYYTSGAKVENGELTLPIQKNDVETTGSVGTVTVVIKSANYEDITLTVNVSAKNKLSPVLAGTLTLTPIKITYGEPLSKIKITGTMKAGDTVVEGTFSWQLPSDTILDASTSGHDVGWTFTPKDGDTYTEVTGTVKVPVAPKSIEGATITLEKYEFQYNAAEQSPRITGVTLEDWSETRITYDIKSGDKATDANDSIPLTIEGTGNYTGKATVEWKITPREVTPTIEVASCTYTGDALEPTVTLKDGAVVIPEGEYTVEYSNNTNAGTGWVAIKDVEGGNYIITSISRDFPIDQAAAPTNIQHGTLSVINGTHLTYTYDFQQLLPKASNGDYGTVHYDLGNRQTAINFTAHGYYIDPEIVEFEGSKLTLVGLYAKDGTATGQIGTVKVNVTTTNYADFKLTLVLNAVNQIKPTPDGEITAAEITYGDALSKSTISGKMKDPDTGQSVNGTFAWTDGTINPNAGDYEAEWTFTPAAGYEKYATATGTVTIKVNKAAPTFTAPTAKTLTYNRMAQTLLTAGSTQSGTIKYRLGDSGAFVDSIPTGKDAGTYIVYYKVVGDENHNDTAEQSITVTIDPMKLSRFVLGIDSLTKSYDGTASASLDKNEIEFRSNGATVLLSEDAYDITNARFTVRADGSYQDSPEAGDGKSLSFTVTLKSDNYVFGGDEESKTLDCNIVAEDAKSFTIAKATAPAAETGSLTITNGLRTTCSLDLSTLLPKLTAPCNYGMITYDKKVVTDLGVGAFITLVDGKTGELTLEANRSGTDEGQFGTITVTVSTSNYQDITLTINVIAKNRITPTGTPTLSKNTITYGDALNTIALSGKLHDNVNNVDVDGTFEWVDGTHIPVVGNGTYAAEWIFEPTDTEKYLTVSGRSNITVEKAQQYGKVSMAGYTYGQAPSTPTLTDRTGDANAQVTYCYSTAGSGSVQTWDIQNPPALNAGTYRMYASIGDTDNYYGFEAVYCGFVVAKAMPTYTAPTGLTAKYGQTLADVTLPDGWSWMDSCESVGGASTAAKTFQAKFTPTDAVNYNTVENIKLDVTVNKANGGLKTVELTQKYTDTSEHTYTPDWSGLPTGQTWSYSSEYSVNTGSNVTLTKQDFAADGSLLTYAISGGKAGDKITLTLKASCDNYEDFTITLNVTLTEKDNQKPLTITGAGSVVYGQTLTLTTTGGSGLGTVTYRIDTDESTGEATIDPKTGVLTPVKVGSVSVIATKAGDNDYNDVTSAPFVLMIKPATLTGEVELYHKSSSGGGWYDSCYTIKATAGAGGSISPSGSVSVREGRDQTFTITPDKGYAVSNVKIDGKSIGAVKSYTFENVSRPHTIEVIFMKANGNPQTGVFVDVATGSYYEDAVDWAVENGITKGTTNTTFSPNATCTRGKETAL